jgi:protein CpxP
MQSKLLPIALGGLMALGVTGVSRAQDTAPPPPDQNQAGPPPGGRGMRMDPDRQLERLTRELNLTTDQQSQIKPLLVDRSQKMQALMQNQSLAQDDRRTQARAIMETTNSSIKALLNDDQKQKFDAMRANMRHNGPGGGFGGQGAPPPPPDSSSPQPQQP